MPVQIHVLADDSDLFSDVDSCFYFVAREYPELDACCPDRLNRLLTLILQFVFDSN